MSLQHIGKGALRVAKNYTKGYSDVQAKVRDATSNDPWGPSGTQMNDIAQMTYNQNDFVEIMEMLDKRLNDKGKNWRHVFKALTVLDYCLHAGSENTVIYFKDNLYVIKTLKEFQYVDEYGKDQGANVRQKAKDITNLLMDDARLREERRSRASMRDRMVRGGTGEFDTEDDAENENRRRAQAQQMLGASRSKTKEDDEMRRAIEASKRTLVDEQRRQGEERDLAKAIALSEQEEAARKRALQDGGALFDDQAGPSSSANANAGGDLLIDFNAAPQQQQLQPQFTSFNPYLQQAQQQAMQDQYLRQQAEWEAMQVQAQAQAQAQAQQEAWMQQQQQQQQQQQLLQAQQEEWNRQQLMLQQQQQQQQFLMQQQMQSPLMAQPTGYGSNNPFAMMGGGAPQSPPVQAPAPSMSPFPSGPSPIVAQQSSPSPLTQGNTIANSRRTPANDGANSHLANLIANREDGMDTFGNIGQLRFGHGQTAQRLATQQTGHNPFNKQQQQNEQPFFTV
ncbi:ENTH protein [Rhizoctonia solani]|uniref:ENTH protein n=1 Tax=Rhizoctonia solani TaxID=456999 RepID=A0A8H7H652_9AGAM|nr:ENTH protein [Rhizoctonia solani]